MNGKILVLSLVIGTLLLALMNLSVLENDDTTGSTNIANLDVGSLSENIIGFAFSNIIIFLVLIGAVYIFLKSICKSFGR